MRTLSGHTRSIAVCTFSPDGQWILSASNDKTLKIWEASSGHDLYTLTGHTDGVNACDLSPDGQSIVSASRDRSLKIWDTVSGCEVRTLTGHTKGVKTCDFSPDGQWIVSASWDNTLRVWEAASGREMLCIPLLGEITAVDLHHWKATAACGDGGGNFYLLDLVGITYGPIIVTASIVRKGLFKKALTIRCPACQKEHSINDDQLGCAMICPTTDCSVQLKINPFTI